MNVVLMNQRNCGGMDHFAPTLYNSSLSADVAAVARNIIENDGVSNFALAGFSMGGNLVLKLAGEWGRTRRRISAPLQPFVLRSTWPRPPTRCTSPPTESMSSTS